MFARIIFKNNNNNSYRGEIAEYECTRRWHDSMREVTVECTSRHTSNFKSKRVV
jgi:hypothetical protein